MYLSGEFGSSPDSVNAYAASSFFALDRYASFMTDWKADYERGTVILANRYTTANAVHQLSKLPRERWEDFSAGCTVMNTAFSASEARRRYIS